MFSILLTTLTAEEQNRVLALWQENGAALVYYARNELESPDRQEEAEDIVSEAFARLMTHYERYGNRTDEQMKGLLFRIVHNLCVNEHRRRKRNSAFLYDEEDLRKVSPEAASPELSPEDIVISEENIRRMKSIFRSLSPKQKEVLEMKLNEEMTDGEIAGELHISKRLVQQRLCRARENVRIKWKEGSHEPR
ncbi:MAG: sigma-70 family RNA polymerase sigma factor [Clostridia bacterium]|nr:sigma-70 family RNA polymerase sigma factor [Clostridia bacterium]